MKNKAWKKFELTGDIDTYLYYKSSIESLKDTNDLKEYDTEEVKLPNNLR